jgi:hypothetical protein
MSNTNNIKLETLIDEDLNNAFNEWREGLNGFIPRNRLLRVAIKMLIQTDYNNQDLTELIGLELKQRRILINHRSPKNSKKLNKGVANNEQTNK